MSHDASEKLPCPDCGAHLTLRGGRYGWFLGCTRYPDCKGTHCVHQDTKLPMGIPADKATRMARQAAHIAFDALWSSTVPGSRRDAYRWMREEMGLTKKDAHIGRFTIEQCQKLVALVEERLLRAGT